MNDINRMTIYQTETGLRRLKSVLRLISEWYKQNDDISDRNTTQEFEVGAEINQ